MDQPVRVLITDDQIHIRQGLQALLAVWPQIEVVGMATNGVETVQLVEKCRPDVVLMDIPLPVPALSASPELPFGFAQGKHEGSAEGVDGLQVIRRIKSQRPQVRIVVLTMYTAHRAAALAAGADAFLLKGCPAQDLLGAIIGPASIRQSGPD